MSQVEYVQCSDDVTLELFEDNSGLFIYNPFNNRCLKTASAFKEAVVSSVQTNNPQNELSTLLWGKYNRGKPYNYHLFRKTIKMKSKEGVIARFMCFMLAPWASAVTLLLNVIFVYFFAESKHNEIVKLLDLNIWHSLQTLVFFLVGISIITLCHEMGHYIVYRRFVHSIYFSFGFAIRYFCLCVFFTNTPYLHSLTKSQTIRVITAGVQIQCLIWFLLSIVLLFVQNELLLILYFQNIGSIILNLLPFVRLDGYWLIGTLLNCKNYMYSFRNMIFNKEKKKPIILLLGVLNCLAVLYIFINTIRYIYNLFFR